MDKENKIQDEIENEYGSKIDEENNDFRHKKLRLWWRG